MRKTIHDNQVVKEAKEALDSLLKKSRVHFYKPIQIGEILYHDRICHDVDVDNLESYRNPSKKWRDKITQVLLGRKCTSSARYQDDIFNENAVPPRLIKVLALENRRTTGAIEAYIYSRFIKKHGQLSTALDILNNSTKETFSVKEFIDSFWNESGIEEKFGQGLRGSCLLSFFHIGRSFESTD